MAKIVILGAGGVAIVAADIARLQGHEVVGFLDENAERHGQQFAGAPILGGFDQLQALRSTVSYASVAFSKACGRLSTSQLVVSYGYTLINLIHPSAIAASSASIGDGAIIMPGVIVNAGARIGCSSILNTAATIDHECSIGCGVHIGPGARLSGLVTVGGRTWIGIGSIVRESIHIGTNVLVGAGSIVLKDIPDGVVAYGSPARVIRPNA